MISAPRPDGAGFPGLCYAYSSFPAPGWDRATFKWSVVVREGGLGAGDKLENTSYLCVGSLDMVAECLSLVASQIQ